MIIFNKDSIMHNAVDHNSEQASLFFKNEKGYKKLRWKYSKNSKFKFIDLFAGIGGFRMGMQNKNTECVFSSEWDSDSQKTYQANFNEKPEGDINKINIKDIPDFDILLAGFPCQPFSKIGMRQGFKHKTQGNLFFNILEILENKQPISFILENVSGLMTHKSEEKKTIDIMLSKLEDLEYEVHYKTLNAADFGVPQIRRRVFIVGFKKKFFSSYTNFEFPKKSEEKVFINRFIENHYDGYNISKRLQKSYIYKFDDGKPEIIDRKSRMQVKTLVSSYHKIQRITGTFVKGGRTGLRLLSENECKAIMGFPKNFKFPVSRTQMYRQTGNAVVVPVVKALAKEIIKVLNLNKLIHEQKYKKSA